MAGVRKENKRMVKKKALFVWGGWEGHEPRHCVDVVSESLSKHGFLIVKSDTLDSFLDVELMNSMDLIVPCWTMGKLSAEQEKGLLETVRLGTGLAGWHGGMCDAFRGNLSYQFMTGGQLVAHPGNILEYTVNIIDHDDPITAGMEDFRICSEQFYLLTDPSNQVLATTTFDDSSDGMDWISGCVMPVVWKRRWGKGNVFYSSLGHVARDFTDFPEILEIATRGMLWASR